MKKSMKPYAGVRSMGWKLDFGKFRLYLKNKYSVKKAYLFIGQMAGNELLYAHFKPTLIRKENGTDIVKGNVDAELVLHTMIQFPNYHKAIIVSGDGDFHCLMEHLESKGKLLKIFTPNRHYSGLLRKFNRGNYIVRVDLLRNILANKKTGIRGRSKP